MQNFRDTSKKKTNILSSLVAFLSLTSFISNVLNSSTYAASKEANISTVKEITLSSSAFRPAQSIPKKYTADGIDISPPLTWGAAPAGTQSFALICEDPDAPMGTWIHWLFYDIPVNKTSLLEGVPAQALLPDGSKQGITSFHRVGYGGPSPPPGKPHRYFFKLYALNSMSGLEPSADLDKFRNLIEHHKIAQSETMGIYGR